MIIHLAEEHTFQPTSDETMRSFWSDSSEPDWSADPMEILMAKQERERLELESELSTRH